jgi:hypothetical protein
MWSGCQNGTRTAEPQPAPNGSTTARSGPSTLGCVAVAGDPVSGMAARVTVSYPGTDHRSVFDVEPGEAVAIDYTDPAQVVLARWNAPANEWCDRATLLRDMEG